MKVPIILARPDIPARGPPIPGSGAATALAMLKAEPRTLPMLMVVWGRPLLMSRVSLISETVARDRAILLSNYWFSAFIKVWKLDIDGKR